LLLEHGADPNVKDSSGGTILALAITMGVPATVATLLRCDALKPQANKSLVHLAAASGRPEVIRLVYSAIQDKTNAAPNLNALDASGLTPLHYVSFLQSEHAAEIATTLLDLGADASATDGRGCTPYTTAYLLQRTEAMRVLGERAGIAQQEEKSTKDLPVCTLADTGDWASVRQLVATNRPDVTYRDIRTGATLLHVAAHEDQMEIVSALLADRKYRKRLVSQVDHRGRTPLHLVQSVEVATLLVELGCSALATDYDDDKTAWAAACEASRHPELRLYLEEVEKSHHHRLPAVVAFTRAVIGGFVEFWLGGCLESDV
jgi:ankyrin repeat protein